jgi:hypothetical protein
MKSTPHVPLQISPSREKARRRAFRGIDRNQRFRPGKHGYLHTDAHMEPAELRSRVGKTAAKSRLAKALRFSTIPCNLPLMDGAAGFGEGHWRKFWSSTTILPCR